MSTRRTTAGCWRFVAAGVAIAIVATLADGAPLRKVDRSAAERLPRNFVGTFQWRGADSGYEVTFTIDKVTVADSGTITIQGHAVHNGTEVQVKGTLDPKSRKVSMTESDPKGGAGFFVTDGSYEGQISEDFSRIDAVWTTAPTGAQGNLSLEAK